MVQYGPRIENIKAIHEKAKNKKDGVYSFRGLLYRVKNAQFTHYAYKNEIIERAGSFDVSLGFTVHPRKGLMNL